MLNDITRRRAIPLYPLRGVHFTKNSRCIISSTHLRSRLLLNRVFPVGFAVTVKKPLNRNLSARLSTRLFERPIKVKEPHDGLLRRGARKS